MTENLEFAVILEISKLYYFVWDDLKPLGSMVFFCVSLLLRGD
uniref:Uncharacterized protein n=1 Tax=Lepeophtheirus salmonis TaxID=72036 RepID=A0A0K2SV12_LEPSM